MGTEEANVVLCDEAKDGVKEAAAPFSHISGAIFSLNFDFEFNLG